MPLKVSTMQPGLLVGLKTAIVGNVTYEKKDLHNGTTDDGALVATWETTRKVVDPEEHDRASKVRANARNKIAAICFNSSFGLLCPESKSELLEEAIAGARKLVDDFNSIAKVSEIRLNIIAGRVAADDTEAFRAINSEVRDLMEAMEQGIAKLDAKAIRAAASRARMVGQMLTPQAKARVQDAIDTARAVASKIIKAGENAAQEIDHQAIAAIASRRTAFLDLDDAGEIAATAAKGRAVDFEPEAQPEPSTGMTSGAQAPELEFPNENEQVPPPAIRDPSGAARQFDM